MAIDYIAIGRRIRNTRTAKGLTQDDLRYAAKISKAHMSHIETGTTKVSLPTLIKIANALNTTVDHFLSDNVNASTVELKKELEDIIKDCSPYEIGAMLNVMSIMKQLLRNSPANQSMGED